MDRNRLRPASTLGAGKGAGQQIEHIAVELLAGRALESAVRRVPEVARPLHEGISGKM